MSKNVCFRRIDRNDPSVRFASTLPWRRIVLIGAITIMLLVTGCPNPNSDDGGGGSEDTPSEAETASALDAVLSTMGLYAAGGGENGPTGIVADGTTSPQTYTFSGCTDPLTGYALTGSLVVTSTEPDPMLVSLAGTLTLNGAPVTELVLNTTFTLNPVAGTMTRSGSITVDGVVYDFSTFDVAAGAAGDLSPRLMGVWKSTDPDTTFVLFFLPGNFLLPVTRDNGSSPYQFAGPVAVRYDAGQHRFESPDNGGNWFAGGGFSDGYNTMAVSLASSGGNVWPVFYGGDPDTWWNDSWDYTMWSSGNEAYSAINYDMTLVDKDPDPDEVSISYSGTLDSSSPETPGDDSGTMTTSVVGTSAAGTLTVIDDGAGGALVADNSTFRYRTVSGNFTAPTG